MKTINYPNTAVINAEKMRKTRGYSIDYMASCLGITEEYYRSVFLKGTKKLSPEMIRKLTDILNCKPDDILKK